MTRLCGFLLWCVALCAQVSTPADTAKGSIEGTVVSATTGLPLRKADVTINFAVSKDAFGEITDDQGKFSIDGLDPGEYYIQAERFGYLKNDRTRPLELSAGEHVKNYVLKLTPQGIIAGVVVDEDGDPVPNATVVVERFATPASARSVYLESQNVDGEGAFKFTGLKPGRYYLSVEPEQPQDRTNAEEALIKTWYPDAADKESALPIHLAPGGEMRDLAVRVARARVFSIRGKVTGLSAGRLDLMRNREAVQETLIHQDGAFLFGAVLPGSYEIVTNGAYFQRQGNNLMIVSPPAFCNFPVEVGDKDITGLVIAAAPLDDLAGRFHLDGPMPKEHPSVVLVAQTVLFGGPAPKAKAAADATFRFGSLAPDEYELRVEDLPEGTYLKSIRYDGQLVEGQKIDLTSPTRGELDITLAPNAAQVKGVLRDEQDAPLVDEIVVIWNRDFFRQTMSKEHGSFEFGNLAPGDYFVAGADDDDDLLFDSDVRAKIAGKAVKVSLQESSSEKIEVKQIGKSALEAALSQ